MDELNIGADSGPYLISLLLNVSAKGPIADVATLSDVNVATQVNSTRRIVCGLSTMSCLTASADVILGPHLVWRIVADNKLSMAGGGLFLANVDVAYGEIRPTRMEQMLRRATGQWPWLFL